MGSHAGLPLFMLLLLLWDQLSLAFSSCPNGTYLRANGKCFPCKTCEGEQAYEKECSETANAVCKCIRCGECSIGEERTEEGCQRCPQGTFNNQVNGICQEWTQCPANKITIPGTEEKDVICMPESKDTTPSPTAAGSDITVGIAITTSTSTILTAVCMGLLLLFCIFFGLWAQKKFPTVFKKLSLKPLVQEVEDCSCRYPEEEEGGGSDISGLKGELLENIP
ncbi:tumor necrosis factor receptor superfamily member 9 [Heteronotia binoei]|uniref:tumor necrosis factor receptor superfamily member 9 n=1 Tax=Heteronotia binoei TaxID=13085 RepID=UPI0029318C72|nr:tumor necrosis factor receptor superfamily member 9 [Heteronotia binoei]